MLPPPPPHPTQPPWTPCTRPWLISSLYLIHSLTVNESQNLQTMFVVEGRPEERFQISHDRFHFRNLTDDENTRFLNDILCLIRHL
jgi:hypothetical protein